MKPSTFFAIFIPIFASMITTVTIIFMQKKKVNPKMVKIALVFASTGLLVFIIVFFNVNF